MKKWWYAFAGLLVLVGFAILGRPARAQKKAEGQRDELIQEGSDRARLKAAKAGAKADSHQQNAVAAASIGQQAMDHVGSNNESMADLLDSWHKPVDGVQQPGD